MMENMRRSIWAQLIRPFYLVTGAPWVALFALLVRPLILTAAAVGFFLVITLAGETTVGGVIVLLTLLMLPLSLLLIPIFGVWFGAVERWRLTLLGFPRLRSGHVSLPVSPISRWVGFRYQEPATWREVLALAIAGIFDITAMILIGAQVVGLTVMGEIAFQLGIEHQSWGDIAYLPWLNGGDGGMWTLGPESWWLPLLIALAGMLVSGYLNGVLAGLSGVVSHALLEPRPAEIQRQVDRLTLSRAALMDSFESERRRIERDLHDGVQQQLVTLNLRLGMAAYELDTAQKKQSEQQQAAPWQESRPGGVVDLGPAREQITLAQQQTQQALQTLRNTVRGIYPAVLEDHGLRAALEELANNSLLRITLNYSATNLLPAEIARTGYYIVNEAITNALKHSTATGARVLVYSAENQLTLEITDNGQGGADPAGGTGITGLEERANAVGGSLTLDSPPGGPTTLRARLPLGRSERDQLGAAR